jgi:hypothetical protein
VVRLELRGLVGDAVAVQVIVVLFSHSQVPPCIATFMLIELWYGAGTLFTITRIEHTSNRRHVAVQVIVALFSQSQVPPCTATVANSGSFTSADEARKAKL